MKQLISWILMAQLSLGAMAQELGEKTAQGDAKKIIPSLVEVEASRFHKIIEQEMTLLESTSVADYITNSGVGSEEERKNLISKLGPDTSKTMKFKLKSSGQWEMIIGNQRLLFSSADAFKQRVFINDKEYIFKDKGPLQVFADIQNMQERKSASVLDLFIQPAYAVLPIVYAIAAVVAIVLIGKALYTYRDRTKLVEGLNQLKSKFNSDKEKCENDGNSGRFLNSYFDDSNTSLFTINRNVSAAERGLRGEMMRQAGAGSQSEMDCFTALTQGLRAAGHQVNEFTQEEVYNRKNGLSISRGSSATDSRSRIFEVCEAYNGLVSCVNTQVLHFVNNRRENEKLSSEVREVIESRRSSGASGR